MPSIPNRVVSLKTRAPLACVAERATAAPAPSEPEAMLAAPCVKDGNFCFCWMPAWFYLAEIVGDERRRS